MKKDESITFEELYNLYFNEMKIRLKYNTLIARDLVIRKRILPFFKSFKLQNIKPTLIREWQNELLEAKLKNNYLRLLDSYLNIILNYAVKTEKIKTNPCNYVENICKKSNKMVKIINYKDIKKILKHIKIKEERIAIHTLFFTGLRIGELLALSLEDIDKKEMIIRINKNLQIIKGKTYITAPKTPRSTRNIIINKKIYKNIISIASKDNKQERIFNMTKNKLLKTFKKACRLNGINNIRLHDLRHSHVSFLIHEGIDFVSISRRLGHENITTTLNIYSHIYDNKNLKLKKILNKY